MLDPIAYWQLAKEQETGLKILVDPDDRKLLSQQLYRARAAQPNEAYMHLVIIFPAEPANELWIVRRDADEAS